MASVAHENCRFTLEVSTELSATSVLLLARQIQVEVVRSFKIFGTP